MKDLPGENHQNLLDARNEERGEGILRANHISQLKFIGTYWRLPEQKLFELQNLYLHTAEDISLYDLPSAKRHGLVKQMQLVSRKTYQVSTKKTSMKPMKTKSTYKANSLRWDAGQISLGEYKFLDSLVHSIHWYRSSETWEVAH